MEKKASFNINYKFGLKMGIIFVRFSLCGSRLIAVDKSPEHNFVIFNLKYKNLKKNGDSKGSILVSH